MAKHAKKRTFLNQYNWFRISVYTILMLALVAIWGFVGYGIMKIADQL